MKLVLRFLLYTIRVILRIILYIFIFISITISALVAYNFFDEISAYGSFKKRILSNRYIDYIYDSSDQLNPGEIKKINLERFIEYEWERICFFGPYSATQIEQALGFKTSHTENWEHKTMEDVHQSILFVNGDDFLAIDLDSRFIDLSSPQQSKCLSKDQINLEAKLTRKKLTILSANRPNTATE